MSKIVIDNQHFNFDIGCRLVKLKYNDCPFPELEDLWDDIEPLTFQEICQFENIEHRRVGVLCLGLDRLVKEVNPTLMDKKTLKKETTWVNDNGELVHKKFNDTYELYKVSGEVFGKNRFNRSEFQDCYYVSCKDTSTNRQYMIWVDIRDVYRTNDEKESTWTFEPEKVNSIQAIAWTIQTNIPKGSIEKIVRQGDCILIKPKEGSKVVGTRHLTEKEYRELLVCES